MTDLSSLYDDAVTIGAEIDNHESDLYLLDSPAVRVLLKRYDRSWSTFVSQIDGRTWFDVPFAFLPWWRRRGCA